MQVAESVILRLLHGEHNLDDLDNDGELQGLHLELDQIVPRHLVGHKLDWVIFWLKCITKRLLVYVDDGAGRERRQVERAEDGGGLEGARLWLAQRVEVVLHLRGESAFLSLGEYLS